MRAASKVAEPETTHAVSRSINLSRNFCWSVLLRLLLRATVNFSASDSLSAFSTLRVMSLSVAAGATLKYSGEEL